jgi:hypothetical protein
MRGVLADIGGRAFDANTDCGDVATDRVVVNFSELTTYRKACKSNG